MEAVQLRKFQVEKPLYSDKELEREISNLMIKFRQIDIKYGLMVRREIYNMYDDRSKLIAYSEKFINQSLMQNHINT
ncbi:hypothetical protein SPD48_03585 [Pseudogracilibacillus sp. SE30717A]|uniref:hypothetical protein n=1 Tax=Pseudogracilibacillus sp. SE30717A TaxID=3098293 RepID=UPI00300E0CE3